MTGIENNELHSGVASSARAIPYHTPRHGRNLKREAAGVRVRGEPTGCQFRDNCKDGCLFRATPDILERKHAAEENTGCG